MKLKKTLLIFIILFIPFGFFSSLYLRGLDLNTKKTKLFVKKYFLPYREVDLLRKVKYKLEASLDNSSETLDSMAKITLENDLKIKSQLIDLEFEKANLKHKLTDSGKFSDLGLILEKYKPVNNLLLRGINNPVPASAYLDKHKKNIFLLSSTGVLAYAEDNNEKFLFKQIKNNINEFINENQFRKSSLSHDEIIERLSFSMKDLFIHNDKIFVSYTNEEEVDCWNTSIIYADLNYKEINFQPFFKPKECVHSKNNPDKVFLALQSGGRIKSLDDNNIIFSTGEYRSRYLAQDKKSVFGKILKINIDKGNYKILSMGSRNPQGLFYDQFNDYVIFTEHGPKGGDEINLLYKKENQTEVIPNYGWPISSYGKHYSKKTSYKKYPLHKSHKKYGFIEPLKFFTPGIGISEIIGIDLPNKIYAVSSMTNHGLFFIRLNDNDKINKIKRISVNDRVRDIMLFDNKLYLFLEETGSIGVININNFKF